MAVCRYHPDRPGIGICMRCRAAICTACCTRVDGVNHCHACLKALARRDTPVRSGGIPASLVAVLVLGVCCLFFLGIGYLVEGRLAP